MTTPERRSPVRRIVLVGAIYFAVGVLFSSFAAPSVLGHRVVTWRLIAWLISGDVFLWQIWGDRVHFGRTNLATAVNAAAAAAIGAFGLGARVAVHSAHPSPMAMVLWPLVTAIPAFVVALVVAAVLDGVAAPRAAE